MQWRGQSDTALTLDLEEHTQKVQGDESKVGANRTRSRKPWGFLVVRESCLLRSGVCSACYSFPTVTHTTSTRTVTASSALWCCPGYPLFLFPVLFHLPPLTLPPQTMKFIWEVAWIFFLKGKYVLSHKGTEEMGTTTSLFEGKGAKTLHWNQIEQNNIM